MIQDKVILITGVLGFLGKNLLFKTYKNNTIIGLYHSESTYALFKRTFPSKNCFFYKSDISNIEHFSTLLENIFTKFSVDYVIHTAAMKHIDICENNINLVIYTNILGSQILAQKCKIHKIKNLIGITTDKSIQPYNTYGYSKLMMEKIILENNFNVYQGANFFWSTGSVLDIWHQQIKNESPLSITSFSHIRYYNYIGYITDLLINNIGNTDTKILLPKYVFKIDNKTLFDAFSSYFNYNNYKFVPFSNEKQIELLDIKVKNIYKLNTVLTKELINIQYKNLGIKYYLEFLKKVEKYNRNECNVFILGSSGMLGNYVYKYLLQSNKYNIICINRDKIDIEDTNYSKLINIFSSSKQGELTSEDIIINCIGLLPHRFNSSSLDDQNFSIDIYKKFFLINSILPHNLEKIYIKFGTKVINITSDCVYKGCKGSYSENDKSDLLNIYAISKNIGECSNLCNIRSSIIGEEIKNKKSLLEWVISNKNKTVNGYVNYYWNGITCLQMAKIIDEIITDNLFWKGTRHILSPNKVSKYDLICYINKTYDLNIDIKKYNLKNNIDRTLSSSYENIFDIPNLEVQINDLKKFNIYI